MKKLIIIIIALVSLSACKDAQKIAYVDSSELMKEYKAVKELEKKLGEKNTVFQAKYNQIAVDFEKEVKEFQKRAAKYSQKKGQAKYQELMAKQQQIQQTQQAENTLLQKEGQEAMDEIIEDVKDFIKDYAKENGFTYILGSNESGSVLYGDSKLDLTEAITDAINKDFKADKKTNLADDTNETEADNKIDEEVKE